MSTQAKAAVGTDSLIGRWIHRAGFDDERDFVLRVVQPALVGMIDGTVSSLAPIFAAAIASSSHTALIAGFSPAPRLRRGGRLELAHGADRRLLDGPRCRRQHGMVGGAVGYRRADRTRQRR